MGAPHFFYSLVLILLIRIVISQPTEGKSLRMQKLGTRIQDALQTLLGMTTSWKYVRGSCSYIPTRDGLCHAEGGEELVGWVEI